LSISWHLDADPTPAILVLPPAAASLDEAHAAIELWEHYSGKTLDSTQRLAVEVMMAETAAGKWAAQTTGRAMPRQNGKGDEIEVVELWGLVQRAEAILHTVHDAVLLASQAQQRMLSVLERPDLRQRIKRKWMGTGQQMIEMRNGGTIWYRTRTGGGGRGVDDISRLVVDEAQHATDEHLAAVAPTLLANANPQLNAMGTSALAGKSDWWWSVRRRALLENPGAFGFVEHTAERIHMDAQGHVVQEPVNVLDRELWRASNPSVASGRGNGMDFLEEQLLRLGEASFGREHLGVWDPLVTGRGQVKLPTDAWADSVTDSPPEIAPGTVTIAYDVSLDGAWGSIAVGAADLRAPYVELVEHREGSGWIPGRMVELVQAWRPLSVGCNGAGPAGAQVQAVREAFARAGIEPDLLKQMSAPEYKQACGGFYTDVVEGRLVRPGGQGPLDLAAGDASERPLGDAWAWDIRSATVPISPLVAVTIARALLRSVCWRGLGGLCWLAACWVRCCWSWTT
jgi:hypothetical protein